MKKIVLLIPLIVLSVISVHAQMPSVGPSTINATGGTVTIGSTEFEWSIGEMTMVSTFTGSGIVVTQGVLQPWDLPAGIATHNPLEQQLHVFPNPATSVVNVEYTTAMQGTLSYRLMDMAGKVIKSSTYDVAQGTTTEQINVAALADATYMLEVIVSNGNEAPQSIAYKIQKLN